MKPLRQRSETSGLFDHCIRNGREMFRSTGLAAAPKSCSRPRRSVRFGAIDTGIIALVAITEACGMIAPDDRNQKQRGNQRVINRAHEQSVLYRLRRRQRQNALEPYNKRSRCKLERLPTRSQLSSSRPTAALDRIALDWLRQAVKPGNVYRRGCNHDKARNEWMQ